VATGSPDALSSSTDADFPLLPVFEVLYMFFPSSPFVSYHSQRGVSLVELIVMLGMISVLVAVMIPRLNKSNLNLPLVEQTLVADIRMARANATSKGVHYQVSLSSSSYSVQRLQDDDGDNVWEPDNEFPTQTVELPYGVAITEGSDATLEFTTRGLLADDSDGTPASVVTVTVHDSDHSQTKTIEVWPSGQVQEV